MMRRRGAVGRRGPGLLGTMARTAVVAGTATAVAKGVSGSMDQKAAQQQAAAQQQQQAAYDAGVQQAQLQAQQEALAQQQQHQILAAQASPHAGRQPWIDHGHHDQAIAATGRIAEAGHTDARGIRTTEGNDIRRRARIVRLSGRFMRPRRLAAEATPKGCATKPADAGCRRLATNGRS